MNVLYLHQYFATREGSGGTRSYEFARHLVRQGHEVTIVTAQRQGSGTRNMRHQLIDGIDVISLGGWYSNSLSFGRRSMEFARFTVRSSLLRRLPRRPDVVIATSTPLTIGIPGATLARRFDARFVFEVRDLWPQAPIELGVLRDPVTIGAARRLERWLYRRADHIIALSPGMQAGIEAVGTPSGKITMIPNASDNDLFNPERRNRAALAQWPVGDRFVAVHAGAMGPANNLQYVLDAARELARRGRDDIHLLVVGDGMTRPGLEQQARSLGLTNITFTGSLPRTRVGEVVSSCDASITCFAPLPVLETNSPNKLFDGLAAGIPNIVNAGGWTKDLVEANDAGAYCDPRSPAELAGALERLAGDESLRRRQGGNARQLAEREFDRGKLARRFEQVVCGSAEASIDEPAAAAVVR